MSVDRSLGISPFIVMEVLEKAAEMEKQGKHVIHLEVGEPDFNIPECARDAAILALENGRTHYTHSLGDPELRETIAWKYKQEYRIDLDPARILVTSGSSPAILMVLSVLCNPGDEVIISDPSYACYPNFIRFIGAKVIRVPVSPSDGFQFHAEHLLPYFSERTRAVIVNSPMNPTGNLLTSETMKQLAKLPVPIISDEIYHGLVYGEKAHCMLEYTENTFILNGFSKLYAMTGLRLGYLIAPQAYIRLLQKIQQNLFICAGSTAQRAGIAAIKNGSGAVAEMKKIYNERRIYMIQRLRELGFRIPVEPTGAFYIFVDASHLSDDSYKLAFDILDKVHVGVAPGIDFGPGGEGYLRFSYANSLENIMEGLDRLEQYLLLVH